MSGRTINSVATVRSPAGYGRPPSYPGNDQDPPAYDASDNPQQQSQSDSAQPLDNSGTSNGGSHDSDSRTQTAAILHEVIIIQAVQRPPPIAVLSAISKSPLPCDLFRIHLKTLIKQTWIEKNKGNLRLLLEGWFL